MKGFAWGVVCVALVTAVAAFVGARGAKVEPLATASALVPEAVVDTDAASLWSKTPRMPGPDIQDLMLGTWAVHSDYAPSSTLPQGDVGDGIEVWRVGPGGHSIIEERYEKSGAETLEGIAVAWWDPKENGQRFVWCDNLLPQGCYVSKNVARWEGDSLVYREDLIENGASVTHEETFTDITAVSFTQLFKSGPTGQPPTVVITSHATRIPRR